MTQSINIRSEQNDDIITIEQVTTEAFKGNPHSDQKEAEIVAKLREDNALAVSLVAEINDEVVGHIAFSRVKINNQFLDWYGLAPVSVSPQYQNRGIGKKLILAGLEAIKQLNAKGCVVLGEPEYYGQFGFKVFDGLVLEGVPAEYFQALLLNGDFPEGMVEFHQAFS